MSIRGESLREKLAAIEHHQWVSWSKEVARTEMISDGRKYRWSQLWIPYEELSEEMKEEDRKWADQVIQTIIQQFMEDRVED